MRFSLSPGDLARASSHRPWVAIGAWVVVVAIAIGLLGQFGLKTTQDFTFTNNPESQHGAQILEKAGLITKDPTDETVIVQSDSAVVDDAAYKDRVTQLVTTLRGMDGVVLPDTVTNYYDLAANPQTASAAEGLVSKDRHTLIIPLTLAGDLDTAAKNVGGYTEDLANLSGNGFTFTSVGFVSIGDENATISEEDIAQGESIGVLAALVILVIVFGALVAAGLPLILGVVSIVVAMGITVIFSHIWDLSFFVTNMIAMIGLAVGIDYALFVVERYREERRHGRAKDEAIVIAGGTASKAVAFSGGTVMLALLGMFLMPASIFRALALGAIVVVIVAVIATLTLIPALLGLLGDKIDWPRKRHYEEAAARYAGDASYDVHSVYTGFWGRLTRLVMARPWVGLIGAVAILLTLASPLLDINTGFAGVESMPEDSKVRQGFDILNSEFSAGRLSPVQIAIEGNKADLDKAIADFRSQLTGATLQNSDGQQVPAFSPIPEQNWATWNADGTVALLEATLTIPGTDARAYDEIDTLRDTLVPAAFGGRTPRCS